MGPSSHKGSQAKGKSGFSETRRIEGSKRGGDGLSTHVAPKVSGPPMMEYLTVVILALEPYGPS
jgi:hypothetical protein